ncbi:hypothetical protein VTN77DRAFT_9533 [Rasamsonia byssochlamydoides]|uniref:uncharacterized protein n=1 Tax=Rasamsonia byssochlamydoides TaxID=89139 RepID=UPI0037437C8B
MKEADAETPHLDIELDLDPLQADLLLQQTILSDSASDMSLSYKRKLPSVESDTTSDTSGRFDDADESEFENNGYVDDSHDARSVHSAKRRRSNDWPLRDEFAYDEHGMRIDLSSRRSATKGTNSPPRDSGSASRDRGHGSPVLRVRRSRFIEGSMNDRVSEKPPSIFLREDASTDDGKTKQEHQNGNTLGHRSSGIFRFGKAIASAFNPFGMWGNKSEVWKGAQDGPKTQKEILKDRQAKAEKAYAELKKSGYKGTKLDGGRGHKVDPHMADETWKAIEEKMGYKLSSENSRPSSTGASQDEGRPKETHRGRHEFGFTKFKSFHDLRKRTSVLNISPVKNRDVSPAPPSHETDSSDSQRAVQKRQSRKELARQAKLLNKISNLEDKLERARRELRELGYEDEPPVPAICLDNVHARRSVPGALPSLPSERILQNQWGSVSEAESEITRTTSHLPKDNLEIPQWALRERSASPKLRRLSRSRISASRESLSRKRKSPVVDPGLNASSKAGVQEDSHGNSTAGGKTDESTTKRQPPRQAKFQKVAENDSPGSGKTRPEQVELEDQHDKTRGRSETANPSKPSLRRSKRSSSLSGQRLKATKSVRNLRLVDAEGDEHETENPQQPKPRRSFYLQDQHHLESNVVKVPVATASRSPAKGWGYGYGNDENIPPVPPVPKELLENAARLANTKAKKTDEAGDDILKSTARSAAQAQAQAQAQPSKSERVPSDGFTWPDDIF